MGQLLQRCRVLFGIINQRTTELPIIIRVDSLRQWDNALVSFQSQECLALVLQNHHQYWKANLYIYYTQNHWATTLRFLTTCWIFQCIYLCIIHMYILPSAHQWRISRQKFVYYAFEHAFVMALSKCALLVGLIWIMKQSMTKTAGVIRNQLVETSQIYPLWLSSYNCRWSILVMNRSLWSDISLEIWGG